MTQADNATALRRSLDSKPITGQGQVTAETPLPDGWASFCSKPDRFSEAHWYAVPPYNVTALKNLFGRLAEKLESTVVAESWPALHAAVDAQVQLHQELTGEPIPEISVS